MIQSACLRLSGSIMLLMLLASLINPVYSCETIGSWNALVAAVNDATDTLSLCPFDIVKPASERLVLDKRLTMVCVGASDTNKCTLRGTGHHVRIVGTNAEIMLDGFAFYHATACAVRVMSSATRTQRLRKCIFAENVGHSDGWRGGAIKTELDTNVIISKSKFVGNLAGGGGAIWHRGSFMMVEESTFEHNSAKGGAIQSDLSSVLQIYNSSFIDNAATVFDGGAIVVPDSSTLNAAANTGSGNSPCNGVYDLTYQKCTGFPPDPSLNPNPFIPGDLSIDQEGLRLSTGLTVKVLAKTGEPVTLTSPERQGPTSTIPFHKEPDGAAVFELDDGGWVYMSNSEVPSRQGGVFGLEFDAQGQPRSFSQRLNNTSRNCAGGSTPWGSWVSCEEYGRGQCHQVDPKGVHEPQVTKLTKYGGNYESMAVDSRDPNNMQFFVTEDIERGAVRRFTPSYKDPSWDMIQVEGTVECLQFLPDNKFRWSSSLSKGRDSAFLYYKNVEGIVCEDGILSFVSKKQKEIFHLDLDARTYTKATTIHQALPGGGSFGAGPDQLMLFSDVLYFTEDGGRSPGIYAHDGSRLYALLEAYSGVYNTDETTGFAFSPDGTKLYFCMQQIGYLFQLERVDGRPFDYSRRLLNLRFHREG